MSQPSFHIQVFLILKSLIFLYHLKSEVRSHFSLLHDQPFVPAQFIILFIFLFFYQFLGPPLFCAKCGFVIELSFFFQLYWVCNPGPCVCQVIALPLSYTPSLTNLVFRVMFILSISYNYCLSAYESSFLFLIH